MRSFPALSRRRLAATLATVVLATGAFVAPFAYAADDDDDDLRRQQDQVEGQIDSAQAELTESSAALAAAAATLRESTAQLASAQAALTSARADLANAQAYDAEMQQRLEVAEAQLAAAEADLETGRADVQVQRSVVGDQIVAQSQAPNRELEALGAVLGAEDLADLTRADTARTTIVGAEARAYDDLRASEVMLTVQEQRVSDARDLVAAEREEAAANLELMASLEQQAAAAEASVATLVASHQQAEAAAASARTADQAELNALQAEENRIAAELTRRAAAARAAAEAQRRAEEEARRNNSGGGSSGGGSSSGGGGGGGGGGSSSSGLSYPVNGRVTSPYGYRVHPIYGYYSLHDGVDFGASCGTPMYAAADGEVVSRYFTSVWGNRLIIDNGAIGGDGISTIYNHATRYVVSPGQRVSRGQLVGYVGTTGWSTGCHLHFTVYKNGSPTNPMNYF